MKPFIAALEQTFLCRLRFEDKEVGSQVLLCPILGSELSWGHWDVRLCWAGRDLSEVVFGVGNVLTVPWVLADSYKNLGVKAIF